MAPFMGLKQDSKAPLLWVPHHYSTWEEDPTLASYATGDVHLQTGALCVQITAPWVKTFDESTKSSHDIYDS